jgi:hypothetical protein
MHHTLTAVQVAHPQPAEFLAADTLIEQDGQDGAIAYALERILGRRIEELAGLCIAKRRRRTFIGIGGRPLDAVDRVAEDDESARLHYGSLQKTEFKVRLYSVS